MKLSDALKLNTLSNAIVASGSERLENIIRWVVVVDLPDPIPWVKPGDFMLTTGYAWPRDEVNQRRFIKGLAAKGLSGIGLAVPNFFDKLPAAAREAAEQCGLPVVEIPWEIPFSSITEEMHNALISRQYELIRLSETAHRELMRAALEADSLQELADTIGRLCGRTLTIHRPDGSALASYPSYPDKCWFEAFSRSCKLNRKSMLSSTAPQSLSCSSETSAARRRVWPIHTKRELIALLSLEEESTELSELECRIAEQATLVIALHISQQRQLASLEAQLGYSFLESLLEGSFQPTAQTLKRAEILGFHAEMSYKLGIALLDYPLPLTREAVLRRELLMERIKHAMLEQGHSPLQCFIQNQICILIPDSMDARQVYASIAQEPKLSFAVSRARQGIAGVPAGFREAASMLPYMEKARYYEFDDLLIPRLLSGDQEAGWLFVDRIFAPLRQLRNGQVLIETLVAAALNGFQMRRTAENLYIHPKTLSYRLAKASECSGMRLDDTQTQFKLQLAAQILSLRDKGTAPILSRDAIDFRVSQS